MKPNSSIYLTVSTHIEHIKLDTLRLWMVFIARSIELNLNTKFDVFLTFNTVGHVSFLPVGDVGPYGLGSLHRLHVMLGFLVLSLFLDGHSWHKERYACRRMKRVRMTGL